MQKKTMGRATKTQRADKPMQTMLAPRRGESSERMGDGMERGRSIKSGTAKKSATKRGRVKSPRPSAARMSTKRPTSSTTKRTAKKSSTGTKSRSAPKRRGRTAKRTSGRKK